MINHTSVQRWLKSAGLARTTRCGDCQLTHASLTCQLQTCSTNSEAWSSQCLRYSTIYFAYNNRKIRRKTIYDLHVLAQLTILFLQGDSCNISLEIASPLPTEAAHTAASGSVTGVTDVTGVNVDVSTFAPTVPEASAPKWTFSTFLAVLVEYLGFVLCIMMLLLLPCFTVNRSTKDTTTPMPSRFIKVWSLQNTISQVILREL